MAKKSKSQLIDECACAALNLLIKKKIVSPLVTVLIMAGRIEEVTKMLNDKLEEEESHG
jgi:hypothetical protein